MKPALEAITIDHQSEMSIALQLKEQLTWLIATRQLQESELLPPIRQLARRLGINMHTVRGVYKKLEADGLLDCRRGIGTLVRPVDPLRLAASGARIRTHTIGVVIPDFNSQFYLPFLKAIEEATHREPSLLLVSTAEDSELKARMAIEQLIAKGVDGLIVASKGYIPGNSKKATPDGDVLPPVVYVDEPDSRGYRVLLDSRGAANQATTHLVEHGHRRIGLITCPIAWANVRECFDGYRTALQEAGLQFEPALVAEAPDFSLDSGFQAAQTLLGLQNPPRAIFAIADMLAIGAMQALKELKIGVPSEVAVVGYTDIQMASLVEPPLTTVTAPASELGVQAMHMLQRLIAGEKVSPRRVTLDTHLVVRRSCGCNPAS